MPSFQAFNSVEELADLLQATGLSLQLCQLSGGRLHGRMAMRELGPLRLLRLQVNRRLHCSGSKPAHRQLVALDLAKSQRQAPLRAHGYAMGPDALFGLDTCSEVHLSTPEVLDLGVVMLEHSVLQQHSTAFGGPDLAASALRSNWLEVGPERHRSMGRFLLMLLSAPSGPAAAIQADLVPLLLEAMVHGSGGRADLFPPPARIELVKQVQQWVDDHPSEPISLESLCRQVHTGRRSLLQGFREHLGVGPMAYIKLKRLHGIRRELLKAQPESLTVAGLAARWGFLNPGHFARDYRRLFGELPSQTLNGSR